MTKKILITGASGFVGRHILKELSNYKNLDITSVAAKGTKIDNQLIKKLDITDTQTVKKFLARHQFNIIYHLAALIPKDDAAEAEKAILINGIGTLNLLQAAAQTKVNKIVYASSASVYNRKMNLPIKETYTLPTNLYGLSKLIGEMACELFQGQSESKIISLRYASIYGYGQNENTVLPTFIKQAKTNKDLTIFGQGERSQDFIYIKDIARITTQVGFDDSCGVYNIGSGQETSMKELATKIIKVFGSKSKIISQGQENDITKFVLDINQAKQDLNYQPAFNLESGLIDYQTEIKKYE